MSVTLFSPAKLNLFLRVLGKRADGYHELASLFQAISLGDTITFSLAEKDRLTCSDPLLPCDGRNLITKALRLFRSKTGLQFSVAVHLDKKIPMEAGLGGGSSNAATTLWALNTLCNDPISPSLLQEWSAEIGSDIPFFFSTGTAYCTGRGEHVQSLPSLEKEIFSLYKPLEGISTPSVYRSLRLEECAPEDPKELLVAFYAGEYRCINDLEAPAFRLLPSLAQYKKRCIEEGCAVAAMTGSGTAFFGIGPSTLPFYQPVGRRGEGSWFLQPDPN